MAMGTDAIFCGRYTILHSQQHIRSHVQEYGHAERNAGPIYQFAISSMGNQAAMEPVRRYNQKQEMVDHNHADSYVCSNVDAPFPSAPVNR